MVIKEYPSIAIDDFRRKKGEPEPELCFLTHMHEDHTAGLARKSYYGPIVYCTSVTKALLLNYRTRYGAGELKYKHLWQEVCGKEIIKALELNRPYKFCLRNETCIQVTLLDANHCPGNAMILIQPEAGNGPAVLFTGDVKCEPVHIDSLSNNKSLFPFMPLKGGKKHLSLYVDETFLAHTDPFKPYVENSVGIKDLISLLERYPKEVHFCLGDRVTGHEEILIKLAEHLHTKIHMDSYYYNLYSVIAKHSPIAQKLINYCSVELRDDAREDPSNQTRLHFCQKNMACIYREPHAPMAYFKPCNQPTQRMVELQNAQHSALMMPPGIMTAFEEGGRVFQGPDQRYYLDSRTQQFFPLFPWFYFSRHASYPEICQLRDLLNTVSVRSLAGKQIPCLEVIEGGGGGTGGLQAIGLTTGELSKQPSDMIVQTKRVRSLVGGLVDSAEELPIVAKKPKILPFQDRLRFQQKRERAQKRQQRDEEQDSEGTSATDSEDEDDRHNALMLLGQWNAAAKATPATAVKAEEPETGGKQTQCTPKEAESQSSASEDLLSNLDDESTCDDNCRNSVEAEEESTRQETERQETEGEEKGPSLPKWEMIIEDSEPHLVAPKIHILDSSQHCRTDSMRDSIHHGKAILASHPNVIADRFQSTNSMNYIDETPDDTKDLKFVSLVNQLRENPSCWLDFTFDFLQG